MSKWAGPFKFFSWAVLLLMLVSMLYASYISFKYWSGIGV